MIKKTNIFLLLLAFFWGFSQQVPNLSISHINGEKVNLSNIDSSKPVVLSFWATWCLPCMEELNTIEENFEDWQSEVPFTMYAISTDDPRTSNKVKTVVNSKGWPYEILMDSNHALKRSLNVNSIPHTLILHKGEIVYSHVGFAAGDEVELFQKIKELSALN